MKIIDLSNLLDKDGLPKFTEQAIDDYKTTLSKCNSRIVELQKEINGLQSFVNNIEIDLQSARNTKSIANKLKDIYKILSTNEYINSVCDSIKFGYKKQPFQNDYHKYREISIIYYQNPNYPITLVLSINSAIYNSEDRLRLYITKYYHTELNETLIPISATADGDFDLEEIKYKVISVIKETFFQKQIIENENY